MLNQKQKAKEIFSKFEKDLPPLVAVRASFICVDILIEEVKLFNENFDWWLDVRNEIELIKRDIC